MDLLVALGISIGILIAAWAYIAVGMPELGLIVWAGIIAWATFYLAGNFWAAVALYVYNTMGGGNVVVLAIIFGIIAFIFCVQAKIPLLGFIPGVFLGAATWVGVDVAGAGSDGGLLDVADVMIPVSMVIGAVLGYISEAAGKKLAT
jgi:hypothetical protein